jgi:hypothetical protein
MNRIISVCVSSLVCAWLLPLHAQEATPEQSTAQAAGCTVEKIVICTSVEKREPVGASKEFEGAGQLYCWVKIACPSSPVSIKHKWYKGMAVEREIPLSMNYDSGRIWSVKNVTAGNWKVEVVDADGNVIATESFVVK